jgi:hypothetical protein
MRWCTARVLCTRAVFGFQRFEGLEPTHPVPLGCAGTPESLRDTRDLWPDLQEALRCAAWCLLVAPRSCLGVHHATPALVAVLSVPCCPCCSSPHPLPLACPPGALLPSLQPPDALSPLPAASQGAAAPQQAARHPAGTGGRADGAAVGAPHR